MWKRNVPVSLAKNQSSTIEEDHVKFVQNEPQRGVCAHGNVKPMVN